MIDIIDPSLALAKLSLMEKYARNFDATIACMLNQGSHQQINQHLNITAVGQGTAGFLEFKMPAIPHSKEQWAKLSSAQKVSVRKLRTISGGGGGQSHTSKHQLSN